ncbi:FKBP-type peptidyl-prolyl cis-trans isomerase [Bacteroides sp.]|uniref:FKBP-type peptidyl-prolyl cis-trans isomerase n=1 Tax=Bacteroides sp. TaxID=29523 RepID=UPI0026059247|nr:FKBP-type peptidyl-prolyl cis-trans isomerase [Bacteroides sp.]MDD3038443.1 FKBP-type peptidyl-prolyl cis-trans isomerase [Bacteroides sp.]
MSKKIYLFSLILLALAFVSCEETKEEGRYDNWRTRNEVFIDSLGTVYETVPGRGGLERFSMYINPGEFIYYKVKTPVETNKLNKDMVGRRPTSASTVTAYYKGMNILRERFDGFYGENPNLDESNANEGETLPVSLALSSVITGWQEALQHMAVGDRWEIYIPWQYAYGTTGNSNANILSYSALIFDVQLLDTNYPAAKDEKE